MGKPVLQWTRLAVAFVLDLLTQGWRYNEMLRNYPSLELADLCACLAYSHLSRDKPDGDHPLRPLR